MNCKVAVLKSSSHDKPQLAAIVRLVLGHISILSEEDPACDVAQIAGVLPDQLAQYAAALMLVRGPALDCSQATWAYERLAKPLLAPSSNVTVLDGLGIPIQWATSSTVAALYALLRCIQMRSLGRNSEAGSFVNLGLDLDAHAVDPVLRSLLEAQSIQLILSRFDLVSAAHRLSSFVSRPDNTLIAATESLLRAQVGCSCSRLTVVNADCANCLTVRNGDSKHRRCHHTCSLAAKPNAGYARSISCVREHSVAPVEPVCIVASQRA